VRKATEAQAQLEAWQQTVAQAAKVAQAKAEAGPEEDPAAPLARGSRVRIVSLGQDGEVVEVEGDEALVQAGPLKVRRPVSDLVSLRGKARTASLGRTRAEKIAAAEGARPDAPKLAERRLDVRGLRVEELLREVERFLDQLYAGGEGECVILHGHGTGALKSALRDHLSASPYVGAFRAGDRHEGGDAVTVVTFRH
jgi:DNA mismatch repair protein MutS2